MSFYAMAWALRHPCNTPNQKLVLIALSDAYNEADGFAFPSLDLLTEQTSLSKTGIRSALVGLEVEGLIEKFDRYTSEGRQTSNGYYFTAYEGSSRSTPQKSRQSRGKTLRGTPGRPSGVLPEDPNLEEEPGTGSSTKNRAAKPARKSKFPRAAADDNPDDREDPAAPKSKGQPIIPVREAENARRPSMPDRVDFSQLSAAAEAADTPYRLALRFKELTKQRDMKAIAPAALREFTATLKTWYAEGAELDDIKAMVDLFCKHPDPYMTGLQDIPFRAFINAREKLAADGRKVRKALAPRKPGGMAARAKQR